MRSAFMRALQQAATPQTMLVVGDLGFGVVDDFRKAYPDQFINAGVAEQNMTGLAAGLALAGKKVFTYSIANFSTLRPLEQIRNDIAYHGLNVTVVAVGGGFAYGGLGFSHHAVEDLAMLRALPNMTVLAPGDPREAEELTRCILRDDLGPVYLRLGRDREPVLHTDQTIAGLTIGKAARVRGSGAESLAILATGSMLEVACQVGSEMDAAGTRSSVYSLHTIKPFDAQLVRTLFAEGKVVVSIEEHSSVGGLSGAILESLVGQAANLSTYHRFAVPDQFATVVGDRDFIRDQYGLSPAKIVSSLTRALK